MDKKPAIICALSFLPNVSCKYEDNKMPVVKGLDKVTRTLY